MDKNNFKELMKKCFGKEKNDRYHAIAMLAIYMIFIIFVVILVRTSPRLPESDVSPTSYPTPTNPKVPVDVLDDYDNDDIENDINYSYSYIINYNGNIETYLGKKIDNKEKFTLIKDNKTVEYAVLNDNFLKLNENKKYELAETPSKYFKYCDISKIIDITDSKQNTNNEYNITNKEIQTYFKDNLPSNNGLNNSIKYIFVENNISEIELDFSNYIRSLNSNNTDSLIIKIKVTDVGKTENFEINI